MDRTCGTCGESKPIERFEVLKLAKDGSKVRRRKCKDCRAGIHKAWRWKNIEYVRARRNKYNERGYVKEGIRHRNLRRNYGISLERYREMFDAQQGRCAICGTDSPGGKHGVFAVDHDHSSSVVRALLCSKCNIGIGQFDDDPVRMRLAIGYLEKHGG